MLERNARRRKALDEICTPHSFIASWRKVRRQFCTYRFCIARSEACYQSHGILYCVRAWTVQDLSVGVYFRASSCDLLSTPNSLGVLAYLGRILRHLFPAFGRVPDYRLCSCCMRSGIDIFCNLTGLNALVSPAVVACPNALKLLEIFVECGCWLVNIAYCFIQSIWRVEQAS